jgi:hypothetical protein
VKIRFREDRRVKRWEVKKVKVYHVGFFMSRGENLNRGFAAYDRNLALTSQGAQ